MEAYVGILLEASTFDGIPSGNTGREHVAFYEKGGEQHGVKPCYFRLRDLHFERGEVRAYVYMDGHYVMQILPIPSVVHNRVLLRTKHDRARMKQLKKFGTIVFNGINRFSKWYMHMLLVQHDTIRSHLPKTYAATRKTVKKMMREHEQLILKPENGSIGKGIFKIERVDSKWHFTYPVFVGKHGQRWEVATFRYLLPKVLKDRITRHLFIVQEKIPLAQVEGQPFDLRVSVQRNGEGEWQVTGIVAKVARKGHFLTNVARGGTTGTLEEMVRDHPLLTVEQVHHDVSNLALTIANYLGQKFRFLADVGLDIGITDTGHPYFIECNGRDLRITFRNANMMREWEATHTTPMAYAAYLLRRNLEG